MRTNEERRILRFTRALLLVCAVAALILAPQDAKAEGSGTREGNPRSGDATPTEEGLLLRDLEVHSIQKHENLLFINGKAYLPTKGTRILNAEGRKARLSDIPDKGLIDLTYARWAKTEVRPYGTGQKILIEIRIHNSKEQEDR